MFTIIIYSYVLVNYRKGVIMKKIITQEELEILIDDDISSASNYGIYLDYKNVLKNYLQEYRIVKG
jgi:hypothetical protein